MDERNQRKCKRHTKTLFPDPILYLSYSAAHLIVRYAKMVGLLHWSSVRMAGGAIVSVYRLFVPESVYWISRAVFFAEYSGTLTTPVTRTKHTGST